MVHIKCPYSFDRLGQKSLQYIFLVDLKTQKGHFEINWPLTNFLNLNFLSNLLRRLFCFKITKVWISLKNSIFHDFFERPPIYLHLIFEISSSRNWFLNLIFCLFQTGVLQATQAVKIKFEIDKKSSSKIKFKNQFR